MCFQELELPTNLVANRDRRAGIHHFWLADSQLADAHRRIPGKARTRRSSWGAGLRVNVEFVSAQSDRAAPRGHGRGAALGDAIASLLEWAGHVVTLEFSVNDAGVQIDKLARSLWARVREGRGYKDQRSRGGYHGEYLLETRASYSCRGSRVR